MNARSMLIGALIILAPAGAIAQSNERFNIVGAVDKIDATSILLKNDADGKVETFKLASNFLVVQNKPVALADIRPNDFVASAAIRDADGKLHSTELRIFPDAMRGVGEGQRPMNDARGQTMTNATVTGAAVVNGSNNIQVRFQGGESELIVDPGVPVTRIDPADKTLVVVGVKARVQGPRGTDGGTVDRITLQ